MTKAEIISRYGEEYYKQYIRKQAERNKTRRMLKAKPKPKVEPILLKENVYGPVPEVEGCSEEERSAKRQKIADDIAWKGRNLILREWSKTYETRVILTYNAVCYPTKGRTLYRFELYGGKPFTDEQREWFKIGIENMDLQV